MSKKSKRNNVVYSTNSNYSFDEDDELQETLNAQEQQLKVSIDRKSRKGKSVTLISGFEGSKEDLKELERTLKSKCGVGGSCKDGEVLIQGEFKTKVIDLLQAMGYTKTKGVGG